MGARSAGRLAACGAAVLGTALALVWGLAGRAAVEGAWAAWSLLFGLVAAAGAVLVRLGTRLAPRGTGAAGGRLGTDQETDTGAGGGTPGAEHEPRQAEAAAVGETPATGHQPWADAAAPGGAPTAEHGQWQADNAAVDATPGTEGGPHRTDPTAPGGTPTAEHGSREAGAAVVGGVAEQGRVLRGVGGAAVVLAAWSAAGVLVAGLVPVPGGALARGVAPGAGGAGAVLLTAVPLLLALAGLAAVGMRAAATGLGFVVANTAAQLTAADPLPVLTIALAAAGVLLAWGAAGPVRAAFGTALGASAVLTGLVGGQDLLRPVAVAPTAPGLPGRGSGAATGTVTAADPAYLVLGLLLAVVFTWMAWRRRDVAGTVLAVLPLLITPAVGAALVPDPDRGAVRWLVVLVPAVVALGAVAAAWDPGVRPRSARGVPVSRAGMVALAAVAGTVALVKLLPLVLPEADDARWTYATVLLVAFAALGLAAVFTAGRPGALLAAAGMVAQPLTSVWVVLTFSDREAGQVVLVSVVGAVVATAWALLVLRHQVPLVAVAAAFLLFHQYDTLVRVVSGVSGASTTSGAAGVIPVLVLGVPAAVFALRGSRCAVAALATTLALAAVSAVQLAGLRPSGLLGEVLSSSLVLSGAALRHDVTGTVVWVLALAALLVAVAAGHGGAGHGGAAGAAVLGLVAVTVLVRFAREDGAVVFWALAGGAAVAAAILLVVARSRLAGKAAAV
ncbi:hypothetical protein [Actinokineospora spheciospongiae]|uniref:hypothetical protein n=1 Tax=Actinokineospora spheciospongiae TaxID=909613 RepID=UPI000D93B671|nr:hypothetical protein [Actinokineospora spheciospongiae]PWW54252.1 hypothetical protein DFQ13_114128 [Actinokineospora spheciospongiae]